MPILVQCGGCQAKMNAPDAAAGRKVKCPKCSTIIAVPGAAPSKVATAPAPAPKPQKKAPPPEDDDEEPQPKSKSKSKQPAAESGEGGWGDLTDEEIEQVKAQVSGKERVLWAGKASVKLMVVRSLPIVIMGAIFVIGSIASFFMMRGPTGGDIAGILIPIFLMFVALGMCTAPYWAKARAGRTFYALTNRRAMCWKGGIIWGHSYEEFPATQIVNYKRQNSWFVKEAGDLVFKEEVQISTHHHSGGYRHGRRYGGGTSQSVRIVQHGFIAIPKVQEVEYLIKKHIVEKFNKMLDEE